MNIINKIKETEAKAERIKEAATLEVSKMIEETNSSNKQKVFEMLENAKLQIKEENNLTILKIEKIKQSKEDECQEINNINRKIANTHLDETVDFIIRKVIDS